MKTMARWMLGLVVALALGCSGGSDDKTTDGGTTPKDDARTEDGSGEGVALLCTPGESQCTADGAVETCTADGLAWGTPEACHDGNPCTTDGCANGACQFLPLCDDDDPCTLDICLPFDATCVHEPDPTASACCADDAECDDGDDNTTDLCDVASGTCINSATTPGIEVLYTLGGKGDAEGQLANPKGLHVLADGRILVADSGNHRVLFLAATGEQLLAVTEAADKPIKAPACVYEAPDGRIFVCDTGNDRLLLLDQAGTVTAIWPPADSGVTMFMSPSDVVSDGAGTIFVADGPGEDFDTGNRIIRMNDNGQVTKESGKTGEGPGNFDRPSGLALAENGNLFVSDQGNSRVQVFTPDLGEPIAVFGEEGAEIGNLKGVSDLAMDALDRIYLADAGNARIQVFDVCQPDCTGKLCGDDGCGGVCAGACPDFAQCGPGECPSFGECQDGQCTGWVADGNDACINRAEAEEAGCGGCPAEACVCEGVDPVAPENYYDGPEAGADPYCCETVWDAVCVFEAQVVCGYYCPLPDDVEWPTLEPTFGPIADWHETEAGQLTAPVKLALAAGGMVFVLDTVKSEITVYRVKLPAGE